MSLKELKCAIIGHNWMESGHSTCMKHNKEHAHYRICERCGLQENIGNKSCVMCAAEFQRTFQKKITGG
ncbi:hypothetical protein LCGC14_1207900 [marine sediment metagenome]|uniref:Uncharacterized protein n=1 Tax=marine sediment metagenome TaxID=412755 RepID=A0A0F9M2B4_9ZZZZ